MTVFGRMRAIRISPIGSWGQRAYEEDIVQGRFVGRNSFILNAPDAIKHVLVDNYENYTRTPAGIRVLRPILGEGLLISEGRAWKHQRRTLAPAFTPRAVTTLIPHMLAATDETVAKLSAAGNAPGRPARGDAADDARNRRPHHVLVRDGSARRGVARLRDGVWRGGWRGRIFSICCCRSAGRARRISRAPVSASAGRAFVGMLMAERRAAGKNEERTGARPVRPDG